MSLLYINQAGKYYPIYDKEEITADITNWLSEGFDEFSIRFAKYEDGLAAYNDLF